jgi:hypothetical protein
MTQLNISGLPGGAMIRIDPVNPSTGITTVTPVGGGMFMMNSFFDIFTDLSLDGGQTWTPANGPAHEVLVPSPEPSTWLLLVSGAALALLARWRRSRPG